VAESGKSPLRGEEPLWDAARGDRLALDRLAVDFLNHDGRGAPRTGIRALCWRRAGCDGQNKQKASQDEYERPFHMASTPYGMNQLCAAGPPIPTPRRGDCPGSSSARRGDGLCPSPATTAHGQLPAARPSWAAQRPGSCGYMETRASSSMDVRPAATLAKPSSHRVRMPSPIAARSMSSRLALVTARLSSCSLIVSS
jgi:hypothetical protein